MDFCTRCWQLLARFLPVLHQRDPVPADVPADHCARCRELFAQHEDDDRLADLLEQQHSVCRCEQYSVGAGSPGSVRDGELLHRIIASPRDYDPHTGKIVARQFEKVFTNGLSVWRASGPEEDVRTLITEALQRHSADPPKEIFAVCEARVDLICHMQSVDDERRLFCVYDQTVARVDPAMPPVATHASIFLRVLPPSGTHGGKRIRKDYAGQLRELFLGGNIAAADYRNGLCSTLNARAAAGEFNRDDPDEAP
jgi:hypothetical protein